MLNEITKGIKTVYKDPSAIWVSVIASLSFGLLFYWLFYKVTTLATFFGNVQNRDFGTYSVLYAYIYWITTLATIILFGISATVTYWLWRNSRLNKKAGLANSAGVFTGALGAACPVCGAFLLSAFGIAGGLSIFPFQGLELKVLSLAFIVFSLIYSSRKVYQLKDCEDCNDIKKYDVKPIPLQKEVRHKKYLVLNWSKVAIPVLAFIFLINQFMISNTAATVGLQTGAVAQLFGIKTVVAKTIIAPKINPDGKTTSLIEQPTISEVLANPNSGDALADAKVVMIPTGKPFYAPGDISFDDPINAQVKWGAYEDSIKLSGNLEARYNQLISSFTCNYCCGGPNQVTTIDRCGCKHAKAWRGMFKYMLQTYGDTYTNEQLKGEAYRWTGIWYPKGVLEDYLLATGKGDVLGHATHGGAGSNGKHGL